MRRALTVLLTAAALLAAGPSALADATPSPTRTAPTFAAPATVTPGAVKIEAGPSAGTVLYVAGDSIMASWYLAQIDGFTSRLSNRICARYCGQPGYPTVVNVAAGGRRLIGGNNPSIPDLCGAPAGGQCAAGSQWASILGATPKPTTVLVGIGINDMGRISLDAWADSYRTLNAQAAAAGVRVLPCTMAPLTTWFSAYQLEEGPRESANSWLRGYFGTPVCDFDAALKASNGPWEQEIYNNGDGIHPSPYGVMRLADAVPLDRVA